MRLAPIALAILALTPTLASTAPQSAPVDNVRAQIVSVDVAEKMIVAKLESPTGDPKEMTFVLDDASRVLKDGAQVSLGDLKKDDTVDVTYRAEGTKNVVVTIALESKT